MGASGIIQARLLSSANICGDHCPPCLDSTSPNQDRECKEALASALGEGAVVTASSAAGAVADSSAGAVADCATGAVADSACEAVADNAVGAVVAVVAGSD